MLFRKKHWPCWKCRQPKNPLEKQKGTGMRPKEVMSGIVLACFFHLSRPALRADKTIGLSCHSVPDTYSSLPSQAILCENWPDGPGQSGLLNRSTPCWAHFTDNHYPDSNIRQSSLAFLIIFTREGEICTSGFKQKSKARGLSSL